MKKSPSEMADWINQRITHPHYGNNSTYHVKAYKSLENAKNQSDSLKDSEVIDNENYLVNSSVDTPT